MNPAEYGRMYEIEDRYWWFVGRREMVVQWVRKLSRGPDSWIVDVGCGTGANAAALARVGRVIGLDPSPLALQSCRERGLHALVQGSAESMPLADGSVDVVVSTDVVEHLDDDISALREMRRVLKPGGHAVITVPAYQFLWSEHDEALMHKRRYTRTLLKQRAKAAGLEVERITYSTSLLFPLALTRLLKRKKPASARPVEAKLPAVSPFLNRLLLGIQRFEIGLLRWLPLPFGLSVAAVLKRPVEATSIAARTPHVRMARVAASVRQGAAD